MDVAEAPVSFGPQCAWVAVRSTKSASVAETLRLEDVRNESWADGIEAAYHEAVFISPPLSGWVLVVSTGGAFPQPSTSLPLIELLSDEFVEAQLFVCDDEDSCIAWARAQGGKVVRAFAFDNGQVTSVGQPSGEEIRLGFAELEQSLIAASPSLSGIPLRRTFPTEAHVMAIAGAWSLDPSMLHEVEETGIGLVGRWSEF